MKSTNRSISRLAGMLVILAITLASTVLMNGQEAQAPHKGVAWDWTHHHLVFSNPRSVSEPSDAARLRILSDPRYIMQQQHRGDKAAGGALDAAARVVSAAEPTGLVGAQPGADIQAQDARAGKMSRNAQTAVRGLPSGIMPALIPPPGGPILPEQAAADTKHRRLHKDWSETLGPSGTAGNAGGTTGLGEFPATFTTGTSCTDYAIYNNGLAGSASQANIIAYNNLYSSCNGGVPTPYWAYNTGTLGGTSGTITNSVVLSLDGTQAAFVQFVPYATAATGTMTAGTAIPTTNTTITVGSVTYTWVTTASVSTVNQISSSGLQYTYQIVQTVYAALTGSRANCPTTNTTCISASQTANSSVTATYSGAPSTVVNLAASCGVGTCGNGVVFTDSGSTAEVTLSPTNGVLSPGSGTAGVGGAQLVVMQLAPGGTLTSPTTLTSNPSYPNCTAPCMIAVPFSGTPTDTYSAPFVAYNSVNGTAAGSSSIFVGDDVGNLHQFTNIFWTGTPSEVLAGGWPAAVSANASLGSPVYDAGSALVFVGDYTSFSSSESCQIFASTNPCGYLYSVSASGTVVQSAQLDYNIGILDSPIVDSTTEMVYVFVGDDGTLNCTEAGFGPGPCAGVYQFSTGFLGGTSGAEAAVGTGYEFMMSGAFDNAYFTSAGPPTGNLYVVGNTGPANNTLYQIPITSGVMGTANVGPVVATNYTSGYYGAGLQVSEFYNPTGNDYIFLSVLGFGQNNTNIACPSQSVTIGCIMGFDVTSGTISGSTASTGVLAEQGGTSGIVVDNGASGASNIYFSTLLNQSCTTSGGTNGCAVQTTQQAP
jgi:hypothetical protein